MWRTPPLLEPPVDGYNFDDNSVATGFYSIPPDPIVSVGPDHVLNSGNSLIEWRNKADPTTGLVSQSNQTFFSALPGPSTPVLPTETLGTLGFDAKCVYDQYANRFVTVVLEVWDVVDSDPSNESRILLAVSKTSDPNDGWWFHAIDSKLDYFGVDVWVDYPGLAVDDKVIYITGNILSFKGLTPRTGSRLWIVDKSPIYDGPDQSAVVTVYDPYTEAPGGIGVSTQPAHMYGTLPGDLGTFLVSYSGLSGGMGDAVQIIRVTDPLGSSGGPNFSLGFVFGGDFDDNLTELPDAPQADTTATIEVNDRRTLNAVWRDDELYTCATVLPVSGPDAGQTTAHWWQINTTGSPTSWSLTQLADVGAEDLGTGTFTFYPSVMVDYLGNVAVGFAASNPNMYCGAYYAAQEITDAPGTMQNTETLAAGTDYYIRTFGQGRNRWGDYSGLALCPTDEAVFWVYNEYACQRGTVGLGEDGRWCTKLGSFRIKPTTTGIASLVPEDAFTLEQNAPNPFNPTTAIIYTLQNDLPVQLRIYDTLGRPVTTLVDETRPAGVNRASWDGKDRAGHDVVSGIYFCTLRAGSREQTRKMLLLK